jgi:hypothetical protein
MKSPNPAQWLELDEQDRMGLVQTYHESIGDKLPNALIHAVMHTIVENQLAMADEKVQQTFNRLLAEGLDRHDTLHAIGSVLAEQMLGAMHELDPKSDLSGAYYRGLDELTAAKWKDDR